MHTLQKDISLINTLFYYVCGFAVPVFFMSTGYILLNRDQINFKYSLRKIISIIRVVCLWSLLFFCIEMMVGVLKNSIAENNFILLFFKILIGGLVQRGRLWQFWYLGALICVYMILPILMKYRKYLEKLNNNIIKLSKDFYWDKKSKRLLKDDITIKLTKKELSYLVQLNWNNLKTTNLFRQEMEKRSNT